MDIPSGQVELLKRLCETTQDAVILIDRHSRITYFNSAAVRIFGYQADEVIGEPVKILMPEPDASRHDGYMQSYEETGERKAIGLIREVHARRKSGEVFPIELSVTELSSGASVRYGAFVRDVTEKRSLRRRLVDRERLAVIGATAATLAHEVGNPLNNMGLNLKLLERTPGLPEDARETLGTLQSEVKRLKTLLDEFRALARKERLYPETLDLVPFLNKLFLSQAPLLSDRGVTLECELPTSVRIQADPAKLQQLLLNLCQNSLDAMPHGGLLTLAVTPRGDQVRIEVKDNGSGIPEDIDIYEPFQTTKEDGTGLGLAVARRIALSHGGALFHTPNEPTGTVFTVLLPIEADRTLAKR